MDSQSQTPMHPKLLKNNLYGCRSPKKTTSLHLPIQKNPLYHGHSKVNTLPETCHPIFSLITIDSGKVVERPITTLSLSFPWL